MPDFTMCATADCPLASTCKRSPESGTVPDPHWQSWARFEWREKWLSGPRCDYYKPKEGFKKAKGIT